MPTLEDVLQLFQGATEILLNIEVKAPEDPEIAARYDHEKAANVLCNLIDKLRVAKRTMVSSFSSRQLQDIKRASASHRDFVIHSLRNGDGGPCPDNYELDSEMDGLNILYSQLNRQLVQRLRSSERSMLIGVWFWQKFGGEDATMYMRVFKTCSPIDFFYSDKPLEAMEARTAIQNM